MRSLKRDPDAKVPDMASAIIGEPGQRAVSGCCVPLSALPTFVRSQEMVFADPGHKKGLHICGARETDVTPISPTIPEAERLEHIRQQYLDGMPLAEFHRILTETEDYEISYAGVRNYHTTRKAPVDYYAQVSRVFGIRLEWLLFGEGEMTSPLPDAPEASSGSQEWVSSLSEVAPTVWDASDQVAQAALLDCIRKLDLARPGSGALTSEERENLARVLDTLVAGTLWILRGDKDAPRDCVRAILLALGQGLPGPKKGSTYRGIMKRMKM